MTGSHNDTIIRDAEAAASYDEQAETTHWLAPDVVYRLARNYVRPGETLLDLGIGSGLSSMPFHRAGLEVYGLDGSREILDVCRAKGFARELVLHDLCDLPLPYEAGRFDHMIAVGVLNSFRELAPLFTEAARVMRQQGVFAFTVEDLRAGQEASYAINRTNVDDLPDPETAVRLHRHARDEIVHMLGQAGFSLLDSEDFVGFHYPAEERDIIFTAYVAQKAHPS